MEFAMKIPCPDEERLADYLEGRLSEQGRSQMEEHLSDCQICLEGLVITNSLARGRGGSELDPVPDKVTEAAALLVASQSTTSYGSAIEKLKRFVKDFGPRMSDALWLKPPGKWRLAPIRGSKRQASENLVCLRVPFKEIETEIEVEKIGTGKAQIRVRFPEANKPREAIRVTLKKGEREIASYPLDGAYVLFENIPFGHYGICLAENGNNLGTYVFEIKETRHGRREDQRKK
jgi:hypothetical protein